MDPHKLSCDLRVLMGTHTHKKQMSIVCSDRFSEPMHVKGCYSAGSAHAQRLGWHGVHDLVPLSATVSESKDALTSVLLKVTPFPCRDASEFLLLSFFFFFFQSWHSLQ